MLLNAITRHLALAAPTICRRCTLSIAQAPASSGSYTRVQIASFTSSRASAFCGNKVAKVQTPRRSRTFSAVAMANSLFDFSVKDVDGGSTDLSAYKGKVVLVTNVASKCGLTPQYKGLSELQGKYNSKGFEVFAFPCNQFGKQEPAPAPEVKTFAEGRGFDGPVFGKVEVNGANADPVFNFLKTDSGDKSDIGWNFGKFLVGKDGKVIKRYDPYTEPNAIEADIVKALGA